MPKAIRFSKNGGPGVLQWEEGRDCPSNKALP